MSADAIKLLKPKLFDKAKWMQLPRDVVIGHDVFGQLPFLCEDLKLGESALLVSGKGTMNLAGEKVRSILKEHYEVTPFLAEEISIPLIKKAEEAAADADFLIGVGGGRVIDTAKIVAYNLDRQFISIPTAASHDGIASARASIPTGEGRRCGRLALAKAGWWAESSGVRPATDATFTSRYRTSASRSSANRAAMTAPMNWIRTRAADY